MLMIVFGAGASFDSDPRRRANGPATVEGNRPPLADQLFDDRELFSQVLQQFPGCQPIIPYLHDSRGGSVEGKLAILQGEKSERRASQLAAIRWYLRMMIGVCTERWYGETYGVLNHKTLFDQIEHHGRPYDGVCIVTFNYDCLIERALESVNVPISDFNSYTRDERYKLFKLHGSINWAHVIDWPHELPTGSENEVANRLIASASDLDITKRFEIAPIGTYIAHANPLFPAIAIPVENKDDFECPHAHIKALEACLPRVSKMLCVGWRATEKPLLNMLKNQLRQNVSLFVVAGNEAAASEAARNIFEAGVPVETCSTSDHTFTQMTVTREAQEFLSQP